MRKCGLEPDPANVRALAARSGLDGDGLLRSMIADSAEDLGPLDGLDRELDLSVDEKMDFAVAYTYGAVASCVGRRAPSCNQPTGPGYPSGCPGLFVCVVKNVPFGRCPDPRVYRTLAPKSGKCHFPPSDTCPRLFSGYAGLPIALGRGLLLANRAWRCFLTNALSWSDASGRSSRACARFWVANVTDPRRAWSATSLSYVDTFLVYKPR